MLPSRLTDVARWVFLCAGWPSLLRHAHGPSQIAGDGGVRKTECRTNLPVPFRLLRNTFRCNTDSHLPRKILWQERLSLMDPEWMLDPVGHELFAA